MTTVTRKQVGWGDDGTRETVALMQQLVNDGVDEPLVVQTARQLAVLAPPRNQRAQAIAIQSFLKRWRFVADPNDRDLLIAPETILEMFFTTGHLSGDCDEAAILGAALGKAIGLSAQFAVLAFPADDPRDGDRFAHVYATLLTDAGEVISLDVTRPPGPVPPASRVMIVDV